MGLALAGNDETQTRKVSGFNAIDVSAGIDLYITMGNTEEVKVVAANDIIDDIKTEVKDGALHIYMKNKNWLNWTLPQVLTLNRKIPWKVKR